MMTTQEEKEELLEIIETLGVSIPHGQYGRKQNISKMKKAQELVENLTIPSVSDRLPNDLEGYLSNTIENVHSFFKRNRVELVLQSDLQYHCFINYKEGQGSWGIADNFIDALKSGIKRFTKENCR